MSKARKRQKLEHTPSEDSDGDASFASFDDAPQDVQDVEDISASEQGDQPDSDEEEEFHTEDEDDDTEDDEGTSTVRQKTTKPISKAPALNGNARTNGHTKLQPVALTGVNMFATQVQELLQQIRPKHTAREVEAEDALRTIKSSIDAIAARGPLSVAEARKALDKERIAIPFPSPAPATDSNLKFEYRKPSSINVVGSYPIKTASRARKFLYIDMVVNMPSSIFQDKDYLDLRYFHKRAFYLACVASELRAKHSSQFDIRFQDHHDDPLRPVITIRPKIETLAQGSEKPGRSWQINVLPAIADDLFPASKITPDRNCVRKKRIETGPTPVYNSSLRADMLVNAYLKLLHKASTSSAAFKDACTLGSTWLRQRGYRATYRRGGIASFEWSALTALLLTENGPAGRPIISGRLDGVQIFKATLQLLATKDLIKQPLMIGYGIALDASEIKQPIIWDAVRGHNILHKSSIWSFRHIQTEAKITLTMLGDQQYNAFESAFIMRKDITLLNSDIYIDVQMPGSIGSGERAYETLHDIIRKGLGDRVKSMLLTAERAKPWALTTVRPPQTDDSTVHIELAINPETIHRSVDHGPSVEQKAAAAEFRKFWSEKAELRRFKDGSITEALIWEVGHGKPSVVEQIVKFLLKAHLGITGDKIVVSEDLRTKMLAGQPHDTSRAALEAFQALEHDLRTLEELPLPIRYILPAASSTGASNKSSTTPRDIVMQFEGSGRWPETLQAIQRTKIAFLLRINELLQAARKPLASRVGIENADGDALNQGFLEIVYDTGAAFRIRIFLEREQGILEQQVKNKNISASKREEMAIGLAAYKKEYLRRPPHAQAITLMCSKYAALGETIELLGKWLQSHVLANHFDQELIELIAARAFVQSWPWQTPASVQTGFLRTLAWLARWDWRFEPLIVDLSVSRELKNDALAAIQTRFEAWRKLDPLYNKIAIFAASSVDPDGVTYTSSRPSRVVVGRLTTLARAAISEVQTQGLRLDTRMLFTSALIDYDFVLHINQSAVTGGKKRRASSGTVYKNLKVNAANDPSMVGFLPMSDLMDDLQAAYGSAVLLFSGLPSRCVIGGLWMPQTAEKAWKLHVTHSSMPVKQKGDKETVLAQVNKSAILSEMARIGQGLIDRIEVNQK